MKKVIYAVIIIMVSMNAIKAEADCNDVIEGLKALAENKTDRMLSTDRDKEIKKISSNLNKEDEDTLLNIYYNITDESIRRSSTNDLNNLCSKR